MFVYKAQRIPVNLSFVNALKHIYGIGWFKSMKISILLGLPSFFSINNFNLYHYSLLFFLLDGFTWLSVRIKREVNRRINLLILNKSYKGFRHFFFLPVRGQRTRTNAKTRIKQRKK